MTPRKSKRADTPARVYEGDALRRRLRWLVDYMRREQNWTQADFARKVGISTSRLSHYLAGTYYPQADAVTKIASKLGVSLEWFYFGTEPIWVKDLQAPSTGFNESMLALASVLSDMATTMRKMVVTKADEEPPADVPELRVEDAIAIALRRKLFGGKPAQASS